MKPSARSSATRLRTSAARTGPRQTFSRQLTDGEILRVQVISGHLWVTLEASPEDHLLATGDLRHFAGPGLLVAEGIERGAIFRIG